MKPNSIDDLTEPSGHADSQPVRHAGLRPAGQFDEPVGFGQHRSCFLEQHEALSRQLDTTRAAYEQLHAKLFL
jgi:hypothetical protein